MPAVMYVPGSRLNVISPLHSPVVEEVEDSMDAESVRRRGECLLTTGKIALFVAGSFVSFFAAALLIPRQMVKIVGVIFVASAVSAYIAIDVRARIQPPSNVLRV